MKSLDGRGSIHRALVAVVDDDESVRESLPDLLGEFGLDTKVFQSAEEFLVSDSFANEMLDARHRHAGYDRI